MLNLFKNYLLDEDGQTSTEYILLVAIVAMIVIKFKGKLTAKLDKVLDGSFNRVDKEISNF